MLKVARYLWDSGITRWTDSMLKLQKEQLLSSQLINKLIYYFSALKFRRPLIRFHG